MTEHNFETFTARRKKTHPADVTADRLIRHSVQWHGELADVLDEIGRVVRALREIAEDIR